MKKKLAGIERRIERIKAELQAIGEMRPGSLSRQYLKRKSAPGPYYHLSYTRKMKGRTEYIRPECVDQIKEELATYKRFRSLVEKWIDLAIEHSKLKMELARKNESE